MSYNLKIGKTHNFSLLIRKDAPITNALFNICIAIGMSKLFVRIYTIDNTMLNMAAPRKSTCNNANNIATTMVAMLVPHFVAKR